MVRDAVVDVKGDFSGISIMEGRNVDGKMAEPIIDSATSPVPLECNPAGGSPCGLAILLAIAGLFRVVRSHRSQQTIRFIVRPGSEVQGIGRSIVRCTGPAEADRP